MTFETGTDEIALENLQAAKSRLRGDRELPTREMVADLCHKAISPQNYKHFPYVFEQQGKDVADALIARGFLQVRG